MKYVIEVTLPNREVRTYTGYARKLVEAENRVKKRVGPNAAITKISVYP